MRQTPYFKTYYNSLSVASVDGTLEDRFWDTPLRGNIHGKSGYISGVRSITGYLTTAQNHTIIFSIITNHFSSKKAEIDKIHQKILELLYNVL